MDSAKWFVLERKTATAYPVRKAFTTGILSIFMLFHKKLLNKQTKPTTMLSISCVLIGFPSCQDGPIFPAWDCPLWFHIEKTYNLRNFGWLERIRTLRLQWDRLPWNRILNGFLAALFMSRELSWFFLQCGGISEKETCKRLICRRDMTWKLRKQL